MELTYATIVVLASMIFVLSAMVGYVYWQQTRMIQHIQSLAIVISTQLTPQQLPEPEDDSEKDGETPEEEEEEEDDRISVKEQVEKVVGPPTEEKKEDKVDIDDLQEKTATQLREMLTKKGIPFGKRDSKPVLIQLLKATA
jgi:hypothetical protein